MILRNLILLLNSLQDDEGQGSGSVLDRDTESKAMLKIAGRELHSDGYREMNPHEWDNWILNDEFTLDLKLDIWGHGRNFLVGDSSLQLINFLDGLTLK